MKATREMASQVLVRDLTFGNVDVDNDTLPPLNTEICHFDNSLCRRLRRIFSPKNSPSRRSRALPSENPEPETVDCWVTEDWVT